jgi:monofunctional chorismate mutase
MDEIEEQRRSIDKIDSQLVRLLEKRWNAARKIGKAKRKKGLEYYDQGREEQILEKVSGKTKLEREFIREIFSRIMEYCRNGERG